MKFWKHNDLNLEVNELNLMIFNEYFRLKAGKTSKMNKCGTNDCVEGGFFCFHYHHPCML